MSGVYVALIVLGALVLLLIAVLVIVVQMFQSKLAQAKVQGSVKPIEPTPDYAAEVQKNLAPVVAQLQAIVTKAEADRAQLLTKVQVITAQPDPVKRATDLSALYNELAQEKKQ